MKNPDTHQNLREFDRRQAHELGATVIANHDDETTHLIAMVKDQKFLNLKQQDKDVISYL